MHAIRELRFLRVAEERVTVGNGILGKGKNERDLATVPRYTRVRD